MIKTTFTILSGLAVLLLGMPAKAADDHDHGSHGHDHGGHQAQKKPHNGHSHGDKGHGEHAGGNAEDFDSVSSALKALKSALSQAQSSAENDKLEAVHEKYARIEGAAAYIHNNARPESDAIAKRFHASIDQLMEVLAKLHNVSHGMDKAQALRLLKKADGAVKLVEAHLEDASGHHQGEDSHEH